MAKSIRSKAKRKLRAVKREKITAKERLRLLAIKEQEEGVKMIEEQPDRTVDSGNNLISEEQGETIDITMKVTTSKEKDKSFHGKKVKRLGRKKKKKYKW